MVISLIISISYVNLPQVHGAFVCLLAIIIVSYWGNVKLRLILISLDISISSVPLI